MNGTIIAALIFGVGFHWVSLTIATLLATAGHWALTRPAKYEPWRLPAELKLHSGTVKVSTPNRISTA